MRRPGPRLLTPRSVPGAEGGLSPAPLSSALLVDQAQPLTPVWQRWLTALRDAVAGLEAGGGGSGGGAPDPHHATHEPGGSDPLTVDAAAAVGSLRTLGTGANQAAPGNDARFTTPAAHAPTHEPGGSDALVNAAWTNVANTFTQDQTITSDNGTLSLTSPLYPANQRKWQIVAGGDLLIQAVTDANAVGSFVKVYRNGDVKVNGNLLVANVTASATVSALTLVANGNATVGGLLTVNGFGTHSFSASGAGFNSLSLRNTADGSSNGVYCEFIAGTAAGYLQAFAPSYASTGPNMAGGFKVSGENVGGLSLSASHVSGAIRFYTGGATERMRIDVNGSLCLNAPSAYYGCWQTIRYNGNTSGAMVLDEYAGAADAGYVLFSVGAATIIGSIRRAGLASSVLYNTTSDRRFKHDHGLAHDLTALRGVTIHDFAWTASGIRDRGVFAQEAHALYPRAITVGSEEDDLSRPWMTDYSKFVPDLIVGWQQHDARLSALEARLKDLHA